MTHTFKVGEPYLTRDGREVRIYALDGANAHPHTAAPIHGAIRSSLSGGWSVVAWSKDGCWGGYGGEHPADIMPPKRQVWVAVWTCGQCEAAGLTQPQTRAFSSELDAKEYRRVGFAGDLLITVLGPIDVEDV